MNNPDGKHKFAAYGSPNKREQCVRCRHPRKHPIHKARYKPYKRAWNRIINYRVSIYG